MPTQPQLSTAPLSPSPAAKCPEALACPHLLRAISSPGLELVRGALTCVVSLKLGGGVHGHLTRGAVEAPLLAPAFPTHTTFHSSRHRFRPWRLSPRLWGAGWARGRGGRGGSIQDV